MKKLIHKLIAAMLSLLITVLVLHTLLMLSGWLIFPESFDWGYKRPDVENSLLFRYSSWCADGYSLTYLYYNHLNLFYGLIGVTLVTFIIACKIGLRYYYDIESIDNSLSTAKDKNASLDLQLRNQLIGTAFQIGNPDLINKAGESPTSFLKTIEDRSKKVKEIRTNSAIVEFPEKVFMLRVSGHLSQRVFWIDSEKNKSYFQLTTCPCAKCDNIVLTFASPHDFSFVISAEYYGGRPNEVYAEIEGIPEMTNEVVSEFLNKEVTFSERSL